MPAKVRSSQWSKIVAWTVSGIFLLGFFTHLVGAWTGPILGVWFVGTQKPTRGFLWLLAFAFIPSLISGWRRFPVISPREALAYLSAMLFASILGVLPLTFHRLTSPRLPGLLSTLPFPLAAVAIPTVASALHSGPPSGTGVHTSLVCWFASAIVWMWNLEFQRTKIAGGAAWFASVYLVAAGLLLFRHFISAPLPLNPLVGATMNNLCVAGAATAAVWALFQPAKRQSWADRPNTVALLQSPNSGEPLQVVSQGRHESFVTACGERFSIRNGIPSFLKPQDLTGDNGKYNHLYETIGGFYDDTQRVFCAFRGLDQDSYFLNYMSLLEVKPGDSVLETSVGTGLNLKYLPRGVKLSGLDLSPEMLSGCQANLRRWQLDADLYLGNAEALPFADSSFDVVFHVGGISFFNDKAKAIREMIRVARPGSLLLIEDETEEYARSTYERIPVTSSYFKDRRQPIAVPIDLVPPEMQDIHLEMLKDGKFYAITFRKPAAASGP